jgi:hypothetical protein
MKGDFNKCRSWFDKLTTNGICVQCLLFPFALSLSKDERK